MHSGESCYCPQVRFFAVPFITGCYRSKINRWLSGVKSNGPAQTLWSLAQTPGKVFKVCLWRREGATVLGEGGCHLFLKESASLWLISSYINREKLPFLRLSIISFDCSQHWASTWFVCPCRKVICDDRTREQQIINAEKVFKIISPPERISGDLVPSDLGPSFVPHCASMNAAAAILYSARRSLPNTGLL